MQIFMQNFIYFAIRTNIFHLIFAMNLQKIKNVKLFPLPNMNNDEILKR